MAADYIPPMTPTRAWYRKLDWWIIFLLIAALAIRIIYLIHYRTLPEWSQLKMDHWYHHHWAQSIAGGNIVGDTTYFRAPLYVYCLGALYALFGDSLWVGRMFGLAIGLVTILLVYLIGKRSFGRTAGIIAASLEAVYPINIYFEGELLLDPLFTLLVLAALYRFLIWHEKSTARNLLVTAVLLGLAAITRPTVLIFGGVLIVWLLIRRSDLRTRIVNALVVVGGLAVIILPIFIRNVAVAGDPVLIASQGGINLYIGNNDAADGASSIMPEPYGTIWRIRDITHIAENAEGRTLKPGEISDYWERQASDWILSQPLEAAGLYVRKLGLSIGNREISNNRNIDAFFAGTAYFKYFPFGFALIFGLAVVGVIIAWGSSFEVRVMAIVIAGFLLVNSAFFVNSRFRQPTIPLLILLTGAVIVYVPELWRKRRQLLLAFGIGILAYALSWIPRVPASSGINIQPLLSRALAAYSDGDTRTSLAYARQAMQLNNTYPEVNLTMGVDYFRLQMTDSARYYFDREIALHPDRPKAYTNLGSLYLVNGQFAEARQFLEKARSLQPYDETAGMLWIRALARDSSVADTAVLAGVRAVLLAVTDDPSVVHEAAAALAQRGRLNEAADILSRGVTMKRPAIEMDDYAFERDFPDSPERFTRRIARLYALLGYVYGMQKNYDGAVRACRAAIERDSTIVDAYVNLASGLWSRGDVAQADSILTVATTRFPDNPQVRELRSRLRK